MTWEYHMEWITGMYGPEILKRINELGAEGWELCSVGRYLWFKRQREASK